MSTVVWQAQFLPAQAADWAAPSPEGQQAHRREWKEATASASNDAIRAVVPDERFRYKLGPDRCQGTYTYTGRSQPIVAGVTLSPELVSVVQAIKDTLVGAPIPNDVPSTERAMLIAAVDHSFITGFRLVMIGAAALSLAASLTAALTIDDPRRRPAPRSSPVGR